MTDGPFRSVLALLAPGSGDGAFSSPFTKATWRPSGATMSSARTGRTQISRSDQLPASVFVIERRIYLIRGHRVMLDSDLAELYRVETRALVQAVKRNIERFPEDFMFQLTAEEADAMRSQIVIASKRNIRYLPYAFTEHGVAMLSAVLKSDRAVKMSIFIVRRLRSTSRTAGH